MAFVAPLLLATIFQIFPTPVDQSPFQQAVMIRGRAVQVGTERPVPNVAVYAVSTADVEETRTDFQGYFYFLHLLPGNYQLLARWPDCNQGTNEKFELEAGYEYAATIWLPGGCTQAFLMPAPGS